MRISREERRHIKYRRYLRSSDWKEIRGKILQRDKFKCKRCGKKAKQLEVHHKTYKRIFKERYSDLVTLCSNCHTIVEREKKKGIKGEFNIIENKTPKIWGNRVKGKIAVLAVLLAAVL